MRKAYLIFVMGIALMLASVAFVSVPVSADTYTGTFNLFEGNYFYQAFFWTSAGTRDVTLWVDIDYDDWGFVDVYFLDQSNFNVYTSGIGTIYPIFMDDYEILGEHTYYFDINPVAYANYYLVIDNTDNWGGMANDWTYGAWQLTDYWAYRQMYGYVYEFGTSIPVPNAKVSLDSDLYYTFTDSFGYYSLSVPDGTYWAEVSKDGFEGVVNWVTISGYDVRKDWEILPILYLVSGYVYNEVTDTPVVGATVTGTAGSSTTNDMGYYTYYGLQQGTHYLEFSAMGYQTKIETVTIWASSITLNVYLTPIASSPSAPLNLQAIAGNNQVTLSWSAPSSDGGAPITNYKIYHGTTPGGETLFVTIGNVLSYVDNTAMNDVRYYYQVSAVNSAGEGPKSGEITLVVPEFESQIFLLLFMVATLLAVIVYKRKHSMSR